MTSPKNFAVILVRTNKDSDGRNRKQRKDFRDIWLADLIGLDQQLNIENEEGEYLMIKVSTLSLSHLIPQQPSQVGHC